MLLTSSPWLHERSWTSVQEYLKHDDLILVPIGATEQHGRHTRSWSTPAGRSPWPKARPGTLVAPPQHVGWSPHHLAYCGALTFRPETLISVMVDIGESLIHHGFKKIVFVNGNRIANLPPMEIAAAKLRFSTGAYVSVVDAGLIARREVGEICQAGKTAMAATARPRSCCIGVRTWWTCRRLLLASRTRRADRSRPIPCPINRRSTRT